MRTILRRLLGNAYGACRRDSLLSLSAANPFQPVGTMPLDSLDTPSPLDRSAGRLRGAPDDLAIARSRCMVLACGEDWTDDTHGWRTCTTHAPRVAVLSS